MRHAIAIITLLTMACASDGIDGSSCSVEETESGTTISCDDGTEVMVSDGTDGEDGSDGSDGVPRLATNGTDGTDGVPGLAGVDGVDGTDGVPGLNGTNGINGTNGTNGIDGMDGADTPLSDCSFEADPGGLTTLTCDNGTLVYFSPGPNTLADITGMVQGLRNIRGPSVLTVLCIDGAGNPVGTGTGTKTTAGTIITAHHVAGGCADFYYYSAAEAAGYGGTVSQLLGRDMVEIDDVNWFAAGLALDGVPPNFGATVSVGTIVYAMHYPGSSFVEELHVSVGSVADDDVNIDFAGDPAGYWAPAFTSDYLAAPGSSGGPVFDKQGFWVGIVVGGYPLDNADLNFTLPLRR